MSIVLRDARNHVASVAGLVFALAACAARPKHSQATVFTDEFGEDQADFETTGTNPFFVLEVGNVLELEGTEDGEKHHLTITVLDQTETIDGVKTRVVEERETVDGEIEEVSRNFFAISRRTNAVYYFGEDVDIYEGGAVKSHGGAWRSGKDNARFGLFMPGVPLIGARFFQEVAPGVAVDCAEIVSVDAKETTPAGTFEHVLKTKETSPLEPGAKEYKYFARGIGLIRDGGLKLVGHRVR